MRSYVDRRICGNCQYWKGEREPIRNQYGIPKNEISSETGVCRCESGNFFDCVRKSEQLCVRFEKWYDLP